MGLGFPEEEEDKQFQANKDEHRAKEAKSGRPGGRGWSLEETTRVHTMKIDYRIGTILEILITSRNLNALDHMPVPCWVTSSW